LIFGLVHQKAYGGGKNFENIFWCQMLLITLASPPQALVNDSPLSTSMSFIKEAFYLSHAS
jgi:hypothetical protein